MITAVQHTPEAPSKSFCWKMPRSFTGLWGKRKKLLAAIERLKTVYGGRYQLYRTNEAAGAARKRGLELEIADETGRRSVTTLSGGEKFLMVGA